VTRNEQFKKEREREREIGLQSRLGGMPELCRNDQPASHAPARLGLKSSPQITEKKSVINALLLSTSVWMTKVSLKDLSIINMPTVPSKRGMA